MERVDVAIVGGGPAGSAAAHAAAATDGADALVLEKGFPVPTATGSVRIRPMPLASSTTGSTSWGSTPTSSTTGSSSAS